MNKRGWPLIVLVTAVALGILALALRPKAAGAVAVGESVPAFSVPLIPADASDLPVVNDHVASDISQFADLRNYRGQVLVLNFWATWCPPCVEEAPSLENFARKVRPLGVEVLGVSVDQNASALAGFVVKYHLTYPVGRDPEQRLAGRYGTFKFPETYIIDRDGHLAEKIIGATDWDDPRMLTFVRELAHPDVQKTAGGPLTPPPANY